MIMKMVWYSDYLALKIDSLYLKIDSQSSNGPIYGLRLFLNVSCKLVKRWPRGLSIEEAHKSQPSIGPRFCSNSFVFFR